ncbi:MAG: hypothetical protein K2K20_05940 [Lachnospiraceae bacterium]|nr:hypothetical protein [Lachnospiraceae bacterium]
MKKFAIFILKFIFVLGLAYGAYYALFWFLWQSEICPDAYDHAYQKALLLQYQALAEEGRDSEVIVFGSSYVPFGIDVSVMEEELDRPVQILGIEAGIGIPVLVDILYETAKPGDTIVYMLGKSNWYNEDFMVISAALESDKERLAHYWDLREGTLDVYRNKMIWRKLYALFAGDLVEMIRSGISNNEQVYSLDSFDERGNMIVLREGNLIGTEVSPTDTLCFEDMELETMDLLNEFALWCEEQNITFVIAYSMTIDGSLIETEEELAQYHQQMTDYMNADILGIPQDYFLPIDFFYNHTAHLNSEGAAVYSGILSEKLMEYEEIH